MSAVELWRPVVGFEGRYEVSDAGRVRSLITARELTHTVNGQGYHRVSLSSGKGPSRLHSVYRLVLAAFTGPAPTGHVARHLNGDPSDNRLANLAYGTYSENNRDTVRHGTHRQTQKTHCPRGHRYDTENTRVTPRGHRRCRECSTLRAAVKLTCPICRKTMQRTSAYEHPCALDGRWNFRADRIESADV